MRHVWVLKSFFCVCFFVFPMYLAVSSGQWGVPINGLQCRITSKALKTYAMGDDADIIVEFKNVSKRPITFFDFQDHPSDWPAVSADYLRHMVLGFNEEPQIYHLLSARIEKSITIKPGAIYSFVQRMHVSPENVKPGSNTVKMVYDTSVYVEKGEIGNYWLGRLESNAIVLEVR